MSSPSWFALLLAGIAILASVPAALLLQGTNAATAYWFVAAPLTVVASGWYFSTRSAHPPLKMGVAVLIVGVAMLLGTLLLVWSQPSIWSGMALWLVVGTGFGMFAYAWRSLATGVVSGVAIAVSVIVALAEPANSYVILALAVGLVAACAGMCEIVAAERNTATAGAGQGFDDE